MYTLAYAIRVKMCLSSINNTDSQTFFESLKLLRFDYHALLIRLNVTMSCNSFKTTTKLLVILHTNFSQNLDNRKYASKIHVFCSANSSLPEKILNPVVSSQFKKPLFGRFQFSEVFKKVTINKHNRH